jgi:hypothetical protein
VLPDFIVGADATPQPALQTVHPLNRSVSDGFLIDTLKSCLGEAIHPLVPHQNHRNSGCAQLPVQSFCRIASFNIVFGEWDTPASEILLGFFARTTPIGRKNNDFFSGVNGWPVIADTFVAHAISEPGKVNWCQMP